MIENGIKIQPHDTKLEEAILGCILIDNARMSDIECYVGNEEVWYNRKCWILFNKMSKMIKNGDEVDIVTIGSSLSTKEKEFIDMYWISGLSNEAPSSHSAEYYAKQLYEKYLLRKTIESTNHINKLAYDANPDVYNVLGDTHNLIGDLIELRPSQTFDIDGVLDKAIDEMVTDKKQMVRSGITDLDKLSGGFTKGEVSIIGGRPGHGKTTFMVNLLSRFIHQGLKVVMFNREMPNSEMIKKIICLESEKLSYGMVRNGTFGASDIQELEKAKNTVRMLYSEDKFAMYDNIKDLSKSALQVKKFKPDVVIDDYLQLIEPPKGIEQRRLQLEKLCNDYKWLAKSENCVVLLASQLNRSLEMRTGKSTIPQLSDLAESGAIEQVAENVLFVHYEWKINPKKGDVNKVNIVSRKCRYGMTGSARLWYNGDKVKYYDTEDDFNKAL
tara:strand:+ start:2996 stop:4321 length:1326 start_codon:yes stop_codon:yes gene_type:complete